MQKLSKFKKVLFDNPRVGLVVKTWAWDSLPRSQVRNVLKTLMGPVHTGFAPALIGLPARGWWNWVPRLSRGVISEKKCSLT